MSNNKSLPDFIEVANIKNLFWNNNSDLYPTCVPTNYITIEKTRPTFYSPYIGTCVLVGEFNHCLYNGKYYFLTKLEVLDVMTNTYKYQLDYDVMINFISAGVNIKGTLIRTDREDILEASLQTTKPILADPVEKKIFTTIKDSKPKQKIDIILPSDEHVETLFWTHGITRESYNTFIYRVNNNVIANGTKNKEWLCNKKEFNIYSHQDPLIVLETLPLTKTRETWKWSFYDTIKEVLQIAINKGLLVITKQTTPTDHFNVGGYVVGVQNHTLGSNVVSEVSLSKIDLSNITDIIPLDNKYGMPKQPNKEPTYELLNHMRDGDRIEGDGIQVLLRRLYLPIANSKSNTGAIPHIPKTDNYENLGTWPGIDTPQKILTKDDTVGYLWYMDKNNISLLGGTLHRSHIAKANIHMTVYDDQYTRWGFYNTEYKNLAPIGLLMYQIRRRPEEWDGLTVKVDSLSQLWFRTGLSHRGLSKYLNPTDDPWWANANEEMESLWGAAPFGRLHLDLDQFNWLSIAPSYSGLNYKYYWGNYWGYQKFFPHAGNRELWYPSRLNRMNLQWKGKQVDNPYAYTDPNTQLPKWLQDRQHKIDDISIYEVYSLPECLKGDIIFTQEEFRWVIPRAWFRYYLPYDITLNEWSSWMEKAKTQHSQLLIELGKVAEEAVIKRREPSSDEEVGFWVTTIGATILAPFTFGASLLIPATTQSVLHGLESTYAEWHDKTGLASMVNIESQNSQTIYPFDDTIIFYLYKGEYRLGVRWALGADIDISNAPDNYVKEVNGTDKIKTPIWQIRPFGDSINFNNNTPLTDIHKSLIIKRGFGGSYTELKDKLSKEKPIIHIRDRIHHYLEEDLLVGTHTFDLEGTDWYLVVHNGYLNMIPKSNEVLDKIKPTKEEIVVGGTVPLISKINQKATFNYLGQEFNLNTKFTFDNHKFEFTIKPLLIEKEFADPDVEYKWLYAKNNNDYIDALITLPRKESRAAEKVDSTQVLMMRERLMQETMNYEQDKYATQLLLDNKRTAMERQREDINSQWWSSVVGLGGKSAATIGTAAMAISGGASTGIAALGALGAVSSMKSDIEFLIKYPTLMKRVSENERDLMLANSQQLYQRKQNYEHDFRFQTLKLNKISGSYQKSTVTNRDAQEKYNDERSVNDAFIEVLLPSSDQQSVIRNIFRTFGCECVSDHFESNPLIINNNMDAGIYRFSRIQSDGIHSAITDTTLREILRQILENGVKFSSCDIEVVPQEPVKPRQVVTIETTTRPEIDPTKIIDWPKELWDIYRQQKGDEAVITDIKKLPHYGLTDEEWEKHKDKIRTTSDKELLEDISSIISNRDGGTTVIIGSIPKEPDELQKQIDSLTARNEELQAKKAELEAQLAQCEQEKGDKHKDKEDLQQKLNEAQAEIDKVKKQLSNLQTEKQEVDRELADCRQNIETYSQDIESLNEQLRKCKVDLDNAVKAQETVGTVNTAEIKTLRAKVKELEATIASKTADLDNLKKECDDTKKKLTDEIQSHKEDKEDLTQQLNNERRIVLNKTDEVNRLTKEKENLENQKFDIERQLRECVEAKDKIQKELNKCKKDKPKRPKPSTIPNECPLMRDILNDPYEIDIKQREGGLSRFIDLIIVVADAIKWMRRSGLDAILMRNDTIRPIVQKLEAFEQIPIVDKIEDITRDPNWDKFLKEINKTNLHNHPDKDVRAIYDRMREVSSMQGLYVVHGVKAALDDLNYLTYKAKETLAEELKTDTNLQQFFKHTYPGNSLPIYTEIFGSPDNAIIRKRFIDEIECKPDGSGESVITILDRLNKGTDHSVEEVPTPTGTPTFMGVPLTRNKKFFIQPFNWFRDAKKPAGVAAFKTGTAPNGIPLNGVEAYNYPYTISDSRDANKKNAHGVWVTFYNQWGGSNSNSYILKQTGDVARIRDRILYQWRNRAQMIIPQANIDRLFTDTGHEWFLVMQGFQQHGTWQRAQTTIGGKGCQVKGMERYSVDFVKLLMILQFNGYDVTKWESGKDSGGYNVINVTGKWETSHFPWMFETAPNQPMKSPIGWFMPTEYVDDLKTEIDPRLSNREAAMYRVLSWMYAVVSQPDQAEDLIRMMFDPTTPFGKFLDFKARP